jgi:protein-S-isoprenylcysteine O-methyltransferase Ste14
VVTSHDAGAAQQGRVMSRTTAVIVASAWGIGLGGTVGVLLPWYLGNWQMHRPLPGWVVAQAIGLVLVVLGLVPIVQAFVAFVRAGGTPVPVASPPTLVVDGFYAHVRNPIYVGFLVVLLGEALFFGNAGMLRYALIAWLVAAAAVRWYEQPRLTKKFGEPYQEYLRAVPAWIPRIRAWTPPER